MKQLSASHKKYLKGLAHHLKPVAFLGQKGMTDAFIDSFNTALDQHELVKIKFVDFKEKSQKKEITDDIIEKVGCQLVGMTGHVTILYRQQKDSKKRKIVLPK